MNEQYLKNLTKILKIASTLAFELSQTALANHKIIGWRTGEETSANKFTAVQHSINELNSCIVFDRRL